MTRHIAQRALVLFCAAALVVGCQKKNASTSAPKSPKDSVHVADSTHAGTDSSHQVSDSSHQTADTSQAGGASSAGGQVVSDSAQPKSDTSQPIADSAQQLADTSGKTADTTKAKPVVLTYEQYEGKVLFTRYCVVCHGELGKGDGFNSFNLDPKPEDLSDPKIMTPIPDDRLRQVIRDGGRGVNKSPLMPSWGGRMSKNDIFYVAAYVRMLSEPNP